MTLIQYAIAHTAEQFARRLIARKALSDKELDCARLIIPRALSYPDVCFRAELEKGLRAIRRLDSVAEILGRTEAAVQSPVPDRSGSTAEGSQGGKAL